MTIIEVRFAYYALDNQKLCQGTTTPQRHNRKIIKPGLYKSDKSLPTALCSSCRIAVEERQKGIHSRQINLYDHTQLSRQLRPLTRTSPDCDCIVCNVARDKNHLKFKGSIGRPPTQLTEQIPNNIIKHCTLCLFEIAKGKKHICSQTSKCKNMIDLLKNDSTGEVLAVHVVISKAEELNSKTISLKQHRGKSLRLEVSPTEKENIQFSHNDILNMKRDMNMSVNHLKLLTKELRTSACKRSLIQPGLRDSIHKSLHLLDDIQGVSIHQTPRQQVNWC